MPAPCTVRPYVEADWPELYAAVKESEQELGRWMPWCHAGYSEQEARHWIHTTIEGHATQTMFDFGVFDAQGRFAGGCGINQIRGTDRCANLGYWIRSSACNRGLASAATQLVARWAFTHTDIHRLEILMAVTNAASQRVAQKVNAHFEGRLRERIVLADVPTDAYLYSIVRGDVDLTPSNV